MSLNWRVLHGDVREQLQQLAPQSVQCVCTSPPYWGLRDYGHAGQIGLESTPDAYVAALVGVFRDVRTALKDDGVVWLNLGDSYCNAGSRNNGTGLDGKRRGGMEGSDGTWAESRDNYGDKRYALKAFGIKHKDLVGIPWRVAFALQADGWYLRSDIIWSKPNPMPESVTDRPTKAHEYIFLLTKQERYFYDSEAITEPLALTSSRLNGLRPSEKVGGFYHPGHYGESGAQHGREMHWKPEDGRNKRSVWHVATQPYPDAHFATYPEKLIEPCILAGSALGDTVLDPFCGSGTTGAVAIKHGRNFVGIELNAEYVQLSRRRIGSAAPLFAEEMSA